MSRSSLSPASLKEDEGGMLLSNLTKPLISISMMLSTTVFVVGTTRFPNAIFNAKTSDKIVFPAAAMKNKPPPPTLSYTRPPQIAPKKAPSEFIPEKKPITAARKSSGASNRENSTPTDQYNPKVMP